MTQQQYLEQNLKGFEGDSFARDLTEKIVKENGTDIIIETGTYLGATTKHFANWVTDGVFTIEVNDEHYQKAKENLKGLAPLVNLIKGNSPEVLDFILQLIPNGPRVFFFLDAHWGEYNPLLDELAVIARFNREPKPIIAIHDFKVPGHPELEFDSYNGQAYEWDWIAPSIEKIYGQSGYKIQYNSQAEGAKRGIIFILPI